MNPRMKTMLLYFGLPVIGTIVGNRLDNHLVEPAIPFAPLLPFVIYSIFATVFAILFLLGLLIAIGQLFRGSWKHLVRKDLRSELLRKIRRWPTGKWDLLPVIATTYFVATMLPMVAAMIVLPRGRLAGTISQEEFASLFAIVFTPMMVIFLVMLGRWAVEAYRDMKQRWLDGTRRERITLAAVMTFLVLAWVFMIVGELAGWDDLLWSNNN